MVSLRTRSPPFWATRWWKAISSIPTKAAYTAIVRSNPKNTFTGWYADVTSLTPDESHIFEVELPKLAPGQFQGLFLDTVEAEYTDEVVRTD